MADNKVNSGLLEFSEDQKVFVALDAETSEVKKAVTIDGDGVETDIAGGGGGDVTVEALNVTENGTYSEEGKAYSPVVVEVESDFNTANVTFSSAAFQTDFSMIMIAEGEGDLPELEYDNVIFGGSTGDKTVELVLYNGRQMVILPEGKTATATGNATIEDYYILVTGDCTITVSNNA